MSDETEEEQTPAPSISIPGALRMVCLPGRHVFEQGMPSNQVYMIDKGRAKVTVQDGPHTIQIAELGAGDIFGEMGVLENESRMATVTALEETFITVVSRSDLEKRIEKINDEFVRAIIQSLMKRLRQTSNTQIHYYKEMTRVQDRMSSLAQKAHEGIDQARRDAFSAEVMPLLDQLEGLLDKYKK
ncbi:MAG: cyclic nucleotide-binding domain-containing protein [Micavibrio aeruginosavorus]|nr:cyclic nucleotide-binding domain-containing protein [Micavibrio aeruginosavorus]